MIKKEIKFNNKRIQIFLRDDSDKSVFSEIFEDLDYGVLKPTILSAEKSIIDIGAHIGLFSIFSAILNPNVPIFAFEPAPENFGLLKENLKLNRIKNVLPKNLAICSGAKQKKLYIHENSHNHSIIKNSKDHILVQSSTLEDVINKNTRKNIQKCDLVKMDCEGAEFEIFTSTDKKVYKIIEEFYIEYHENLPDLNKNSIVNILKPHYSDISVVPSHYQKNLGFIKAKHKI